MNFIPLASSSRGNAYLLQAEGVQPLLLEAGLPIRQLRDKLRDHGVSLADLAGCLVSHEHGDHAKAVKDLLKAGVDCYASLGTIRALSVMHHRIHIVSSAVFRVNEWVVRPFDLEHDAEEPKGFLIATTFGARDTDSLLFIPDTSFLENRFQGVTMIAVECNNISELLSKNILKGHIPAIVGRRVRRNHMSLENLIQMLKANDLSRCRQIFLMHLSDSNSDERAMKEAVQAATGIPTIIC